MRMIHTKPDTSESVRYSLFSHDVTKNSNEAVIDSSEFLLSGESTAPKHLYLCKFLRKRTLELPGFCLTQHLAGGRESSYVG